MAQKLPKITQIGPKMTQNCPNWPKNYPKWPFGGRVSEALPEAVEAVDFVRKRKRQIRKRNRTRKRLRSSGIPQTPKFIQILQYLEIRMCLHFDYLLYVIHSIFLINELIQGWANSLLINKFKKSEGGEYCIGYIGFLHVYAPTYVSDYKHQYPQCFHNVLYLTNSL